MSPRESAARSASQRSRSWRGDRAGGAGRLVHGFGEAIANGRPTPPWKQSSVPNPRGRSDALDSRVGDGIHVRLLWHPTDGHVSLAVADSKTGERFDLPVRDGDGALDVFEHPFA